MSAQPAGEQGGRKISSTTNARNHHVAQTDLRGQYLSYVYGYYGWCLRNKSCPEHSLSPSSEVQKIPYEISKIGNCGIPRHRPINIEISNQIKSFFPLNSASDRGLLFSPPKSRLGKIIRQLCPLFYDGEFMNSKTEGEKRLVYLDVAWDAHILDQVIYLCFKLFELNSSYNWG